ncbi:unnamed protein product [Allacma fusca]|uniref:Uncharacterized protein n=1 Tax=Allacma fusca TaxID=39272 RepID=A0A8J2NQE9_9HEXA|nr:unnamed protein product [Allacma fusca]
MWASIGVEIATPDSSSTFEASLHDFTVGDSIQFEAATLPTLTIVFEPPKVPNRKPGTSSDQGKVYSGSNDGSILDQIR